MKLLKVFIYLIIIVGTFLLFYYGFITKTLILNKSIFHNEYIANATVSSTVNNLYAENIINIWCIFTKVYENSPLPMKFEKLMRSLFTFNSVPLHINIISDEASKVIAEHKLENMKNISKTNISYSFIDIKFCADEIDDIVQIMMPHFSSKPGTYYGDALFYLSLGLYRIANKDQKQAIMLDCDVQFADDILLLYNEFNKFKSTNLFGLAPELNPVYRHVLHSYRNHRNTSFGEYVHSKPIVTSGNHLFGFPGYNSGVILFNLSAIRESNLYRNVISKTNVDNLVAKYKFRGHLGDQDFYTLLGYEYPDLFRTLPCNFNRQLCVWWRDYGYKDVFDHYFKCDGKNIIYHGNCNTPISF